MLSLDLNVSAGHRSDVARLRRNAQQLIRCFPGCELLHENPNVSRRLSSAGLSEDDHVVLRVEFSRTQADIVCIPARNWREPEKMQAYFEVRNAAREAGEKILLVPEGFVQRQPRLDNAGMLERAEATRLTPTDRMAVLVHLIETGDCGLVELAGVVAEHPDPVGAILALVVDGVLEMDLDKAIGPHSLVSMSADRERLQ